MYEVPEVARPAVGAGDLAIGWVASAAALEVAGGNAALEEDAGGGVEEAMAVVVDGREEVGKIDEEDAADVDKIGGVLVRIALVENAIATDELVAMTGLSVEVEGADTSMALIVGATGAAPAVTQIVFTTT